MQANLTVKGQVTIPKAMRDHLGLAPGAAVRFAYTEDGSVVILPARGRRTAVKAKPSRFDKLKGSNRAGWAATGLKSTDEIMGLLRGYEEDARDPGFAPAASRLRPASTASPPSDRRR